MKLRNGTAMTLIAEGFLVDRFSKSTYNKHIKQKRTQSMWRIVYIDDMYAIMNVLTEETAGWYEFRSEAKEALEYFTRTGQL
jgi:hypothetical protein